MDLKIKDVAELLNTSEGVVEQWIREEKIPSYTIDGEHFFNPAEIEDWVMHQKLGVGESKIRHMQYSLYRALHRGDVLKDVVGRTKKEIIRTTMDYMATRVDLDPTVLTDLFLDRERLMSTAVGHGIAIPHTRDFLLDTHYDVIVTVYPQTPLEYGALDGEPVHTLFFLFACEDKLHLHLLAKLAHLNASPETRAFLAAKPTKEQLLERVKEWESSLKGDIQI